MLGSPRPSQSTMKITRAFLLAAACVVLLPAAMPVRAASCNGASHELTLSRGTATPGSGSTTTTIVFSVLYTDNAGCVPSSITVTIAGLGTFPLAAGVTSSAGVTYQRSTTLPAGRWTYAFSATAGSGPGEVTVQLSNVSPSAVTITSPTPKPTAVPTAIPTPRPTPAPTIAPPPPATPPPATPTARPTPSPTPTEVPSVGPSDTEQPSPSGSPRSGSPTPSVTVGATPEVSEPTSAPGPGSGSIDQGGGRFPTLPVPGELIAYLLLTSAGLGLFLLLVGRRRAPDRDPAMAGAVAGPPVAGNALHAVTPLPTMRELIPPVDPDLLRNPDDLPGPHPDEAGIPRWLRPSVRAGRFDGVRDRRRDGG